VAEHAESARRVAEGPSGFGRGAAFEVIGSERFILALFGVLRIEEEALRIC